MEDRHSVGVGRRRFVRTSALAMAGVAGAHVAPLDALASWNLQHEDAPNQHNMLVVGERTVFLSHLPMFQGGQPDDPAVDAAGTEFTSPHRYQVILEATFKKQGKDVGGVYAGDRRAHPRTRIYTLEPRTSEPFVLPHLFTPAGHPRRASFTATVFRGHLERGGQPIEGLNPVLVEITRVVHARKLSPQQKPPAQLEYILFGTSSEFFLAHAIVAPPDFDQVLSITMDGHEFTDSDLKRDLRVRFPDRKNVVADRLREGQKISAVLSVAGDTDAAAIPIKMQASVEYYFEEGELLVPYTFEPTPEESKEQ